MFAALIHITSKIELSTQIPPVDLPDNCSPLKTDNVIAIGHGNTNNNGVRSDQLNFATMQIVPSSVCHEAFPIIFGERSVFCALNINSNQSVCDGDSGGPLISETDHELVGISSFIGPGEIN